MTIRSADLTRYEERTDGFKYQPDLQDCLPVAVKNILDDLSQRHEKPQIKFSESDIKDMSDYDPDFGSTGRYLVANLSTELENYGYTVKDQVNASPQRLEKIIQSDKASQPVVSVCPKYFDQFENWDPRGSRRGKNRPHSLIVFKINSDEVLFFDPYGKIQLRSGSVTEEKKRWERREFFDCWNTETSFPRWVLWIDRLQETTLEHFTGDN